MPNNCVLLLATLCIVPPEKPVGLIYEFSGKVELISKAGKTVPLRPKQLNYVFSEDRLKVGPDAQLTVGFFKDYHWEKMKPGEIEIAADHGEPADLCERKEAPEKLRGPAGKNAVEAVGSGKGAGLVFRDAVAIQQIPRITPVVGEAIASDRPEFTWAPIDGASGYQVTLTFVGSDRPVWSTQVSEASAKFPIEKNPLMRKRIYNWQLIAQFENSPSQLVARGRFTVVGPETAKIFESIAELADSENAIDQILAVSGYQKENADGPALAAAEKLVKVAPSADLYRLLADLYHRAGRQTERETAIEKAIQLESSSDQIPPRK
jgi:hypothetical protein